MTRDRYFEWIKGKTVSFCGVGRTHMPLVKLFREKGAIVSVRDKRGLSELGEYGRALSRMENVKLILGEGYLRGLTEDVVFRTPAMRYDLPELQRAKKRGSVITSEMETFFELCPCKIYAVTGSDGKTTTTTILSEFLKAAGKTVWVGGNIGKPLLPEIENVKAEDAAVVELSSFQLISMRESPDVAVVTNLSPNHLDWHTDLGEYFAAKKNIFLHQSACSRTILNADNEVTAGFQKEVRGDCWMFSRRGRVPRGLWCDGEAIYFNDNDSRSDELLLRVEDIKIPGWHNVENYMAAMAAAWGDVPLERMRQVARQFNGVEHRAEFVREVDGVKYYNDSIASSPTRTISGTLSLYPRKIILIAGGYDKRIPYAPLGPVVCDKVKTLIVMGATGPKIEEAVKAAENYREGAPEILHAKDMEEAVSLARRSAESGDIVSLSPASAAFDLYPNFEARGRHFKELVDKL